MKSHSLSNGGSGSKQTFISLDTVNMATFTITSLLSFFHDEPKSINRGENHYKSDHIQAFSYADGVVRGEVQASMKKKV